MRRVASEWGNDIYRTSLFLGYRGAALFTTFNRFHGDACFLQCLLNSKTRRCSKIFGRLRLSPYFVYIQHIRNKVKASQQAFPNFLSFCDFFDSMSHASHRLLAWRLLFTKLQNLNADFEVRFITCCIQVVLFFNFL